MVCGKLGMIMDNLGTDGTIKMVRKIGIATDNLSIEATIKIVRKMVCRKVGIRVVNLSTKKSTRWVA